MQFVGIAIVLIGAYLLDSARANRPPVGTITALINDPSDLYGTIQSLNGTWTTVVGGTKVRPGAADAPGNTNSSGAKTPGGVSGKLSDDQLVKLSWTSGRLAPKAAAAFEQLNKAYAAEFGKNIPVSDTYRSYEQQVATKRAKGNLAATPGKSNHGWGLAVDLGRPLSSFGTKEHDWMVANAPRYGWVLPSWAQRGGSKPEPWHFEYTGS